MSRRERGESQGSSRIWVAIVATALIGVTATALAVGGLAMALRSDPAGCAPVAWGAVSDGAALPAGWSMVSNQVGVDTLSTTFAGPTPSASTQRPVVFASVSCYGNDAALALRRAHEGALAAGGADVAFATVGDESFVVFSQAATSTTLLMRRGDLVGELTAPTSVDRPTLEGIGRAVDTAMVRSIAVPPDASPIAQPSAAPSSAPGPGEQNPSSSPALPSSSASPAAVSHEAPDLERLLPTIVGSTSLASQSVLGTTALGSGTASDQLKAALQKLGKSPADLQIAGAYDPAGTLDLRLFAYRVAGVDTSELARALIESQLANTAAQATSSQVTIAGHPITKISYAQGTPVYFYLLNDVVYAIQSGDPTLVGTVVGLLK